MLLMDFLSIKGEYLPDCAKKSTWNLLFVYMDAHIQCLFDEYPQYVLQTITILKSQCANMTFSIQIRYNIMFHQVVHKRGELEINCIKKIIILRLW